VLAQRVRGQPSQTARAAARARISQAHGSGQAHPSSGRPAVPEREETQPAEEGLAVPPHAQLEHLRRGHRRRRAARPGHALVLAQQGVQPAQLPEQAPEPNERERKEPAGVLEPRVRLERRPAVS
jgi:hypothetical protein